MSIIVKQLNDVTEVPTGAISYSTERPGDGDQVVNGSHVVKQVTVGAAETGRPRSPAA